jgi:uncharacterized protein YkwD
MAQAQGRLGVRCTVTVDKYEAGQHVGTVERVVMLENGEALAALNGGRAAQGLPALTEDEALRQLQREDS